MPQINRDPLFLSGKIRKYSGKITAVFCLQISLIMGMETSYVAVFTGNPGFDRLYLQPSALLQGLLQSSYPLMACFGSLLVPIFSCRLSKRTQAITYVYIWASGYILTIVAPAYWPLVIGRGIKGLAIGFLSGIIPPYIQECFEESQSVFLLSLFQSFFPLGIFVMAFVAYMGCLAPFSIFKVSICWSIMMALTMPALVLCLFIRSSPNDFILRGYNIQATDVLKDIYESNQTEISKQFNTRYLLCRRQISKSSWSHIRDAFTPEIRRRIYLAMFCQASVQLSGINVIMYYLGYVCTLGKVPAEWISVVMLAVYLINFVFNFVGGLKTCQLRRSKLMSLGYTGMCLCHLVVFSCLLIGSRWLPNLAMTPTIGIVALVFEMIAVAVFGVCIATPSMLYTTEIIPPISRNQIIPLAVSVGWFLHFALALLVPLLFLSAGPFTFFGFSICCSVLLIISMMYIETKDKSEEDLAEYAQKPLSPISVLLNLAGWCHKPCTKVLPRLSMSWYTPRGCENQLSEPTSPNHGLSSLSSSSWSSELHQRYNSNESSESIIFGSHLHEQLLQNDPHQQQYQHQYQRQLLSNVESCVRATGSSLETASLHARVPSDESGKNIV